MTQPFRLRCARRAEAIFTFDKSGATLIESLGIKEQSLNSDEDEYMKKAVISTGAKQYLVSEGEQIEVELLKDANKTVSFTPLLVTDSDKTTVGTPELKDAKVTADVIDADVQKDKVTSIRFKAKKRVNKKRGHRQHKTVLAIKKIQ